MDGVVYALKDTESECANPAESEMIIHTAALQFYKSKKTLDMELYSHKFIYDDT